MAPKEYILIDSQKVAEIKYKALQKLARHSGEPLSEASIEARAVIDVVNYLYENNEWIDIHNRDKSDETGYQDFRYTEFKIREREVEKISEDEARIREILNDPSSMFVGYSQEGYNLHIWINQGKKYYIEPELNRINRIEY
jgi:hypothetical protein